MAAWGASCAPAIWRARARRGELKELLDDNLRARFEREARLTARLQHPAIVNVHEAGRWPSGAPFYVMKYVAGEPLDRLIASTRTLAERLGYLANVTAVVEAIAYAHSERVLHRDLKPGNILIGPFGETVVIDWGLAKDLTEVNAEAASELPYRESAPLTIGGIGTPAYMPPEQARGPMDDPRLDVYALGATLYHLVAGERPFGENLSANQVLDRLRDDGPPPISTIEPATPPELAAIIAKAMARDPAERYATAGELAEELKRYQTGQLIGAHRYTLAELWARWLRRHRAPVALAGIFVVALAAVGGVSVSRVVAARHTTEHQVGELLVERGERELVAGYPSRALVYFVAAMKRGLDTPALRFSTAQASRPTQALISSVQLGGPLVAVAVRGDGKELAVAPKEGPVEIRDVVTGQRRFSLGPSTEGTSCIAYGGDGKVLLTAAECGWRRGVPLVYLWNADTGALTMTLPLREDLEWAGVSEDGQRFLTTGRHNASAWTTDGKLIGSVEADQGHRMPAAFSPDGRKVAIFGEDNHIQVFELDTGRLAATLAPMRTGGNTRLSLRSRPDDLHSIVFDAKGEQIFVGVWAGETEIFDVATGQVVKTLETGTDGIEPWGESEIAARFSVDGERLLTWGTQNDARLWFPYKDSPLHSEQSLPQTAEVVRAWFIGDDAIVTASKDGVVRLWGSFGQERDVFDLHTGPILTVQVSGDSRRAVTVGEDGSVKAWKLEPPYLALDPKTMTVAFDDRGRMLALGEELISLWDRTTGVRLAHAEVKPGNCDEAVFAKSGTAALLHCMQTPGTFRTWDLATGVVSPSDPEAKFVFSGGGVSADGQRGLELGEHAKIIDPRGNVIANLQGSAFSLSASRNVVVGFADETDTVDVWDFQTGAKLHSLAIPHPQAARGSRYMFASPGAEIIVSEHDDRMVIGPAGWPNRRQVSVWDLKGNHIADIDSSVPMPEIVLSHGGHLLLAFDSLAGTQATVWSTDTGKRVCVLDSRSDPIDHGVFALDDALVVTGTRGGHIKVWDATTGELLAAAASPGREVYALSLSPDGKQVFIETSVGSGLWDLHEEPLDLAAESALAERVPLQLDGVRLEPRAANDLHPEPLGGGAAYTGKTQDAANVLLEQGRLRDAAEQSRAAYDTTKWPGYLLAAGVSYGNGRMKDEAIDMLTRYLATNPSEAAKAPVEKMLAGLRDAEHLGLDGIAAPGLFDELVGSGRFDEAEATCAFNIVRTGDWGTTRPAGPRAEDLLFDEINRFTAPPQPVRATRLLRLLIEVSPPDSPARAEAARRIAEMPTSPFPRGR